MKESFYSLTAIILSIGLLMTSCSQAVTEGSPTSLSEESVSETTIEPFEPIDISEDYDGPILGIENWHREEETYWWLYVNDDTGEPFARCLGKGSVWLADLNNDGEPELVCVERYGINWDNHTEVYKLEDGVIYEADICVGTDYMGQAYYPDFAEIYGLEIDYTNYLDYSDTYDPDRNMIIVTDSATGTEYEVLWDYLFFYSLEEINEMCGLYENDSSDTSDQPDIPSDIIDISYTAAEPVITDITDTEKAITFYRDGMEIEGMLYLPGGDGPFPVIVLCCGLMQPYTDYEADAQGFADNGYAAVVFSFIDYSDPDAEAPNPDEFGTVFLSETRDLYAVLDSLEYLPNVDSDQVYLWGHSLGGLISSYAGCDRALDVNGMILVEPAIVVGEELTVTYEDGSGETLRIYDLLESCDLDTVIYMGTHDGYGDDPTSFDQVLELMPSAELVIIDGADHFFEGEYGEAMVEDACGKIASWND